MAIYVRVRPGAADTADRVPYGERAPEIRQATAFVLPPLPTDSTSQS